MPPSEDELRVIPEAVRAEGAKYVGLGHHMTKVKTSVDELTLTSGAFFVGNLQVSDAAAKSYSNLHTMMAMIIGEASTEFHELGGALRKAADEYERTDGENADDLSKIYGN